MPCLAQDPLEHQEQAEAGGAQHAQDQGVDQVDPQLDPHEAAHL